MKNMILDMEKYFACARKTAAEGQVLLRNENHALPIRQGAEVAVFGRIQFHYYKSGTGSGGMVNVDKVTGILDGLLESPKIKVNRKLMEVYQAWEKEHPFDVGIGWGNEPWSQEEMPLTEELVREVSSEAEYGIVIIGRTAGEDRDNLNHPGSWLLTETEEDMLQKVRDHFAKMIVVLNVGNIMDMGFVDRVCPDAVLYAWQGGMAGGAGTADVLTGEECPSGKLADTIAYKITDYPSDSNFGNLDKNIYEEDIYVGYRYFETAAAEKVRYPFGFGLSYTTFAITSGKFEADTEQVKLEVFVKNTGSCAGKEVVQIYVQAPQGQLGKPYRVLAAFQKTKKLMPEEETVLSFEIPFAVFASYDETGKSGFPSSYVLEAGEYLIEAGTSVREVTEAGRFQIEETKLIRRCTAAMIPEKRFRRMKPQLQPEGRLLFGYEEVQPEGERPSARRARSLPAAWKETGNQGYQLSDVAQGRVSMEDFIAQLSEEELTCIARGEGMGSPKVTPGTAGAFGGISESLKNYGIPCGCCADGPSGMRLDSGAKAFSLPSGTLLACTFHTQLVEELYTFTGVEMVKNGVDVLLGPGMNIHRHPLNGRNFEYFSEDPLLTGKMAAAQIRALHKCGVSGSLKHFCGNNQETKRSEIDSVISQRALREIYLKGFEIAVREAGADVIMTTYGAVNGIWTAGNYDLNTVILRGEWGFQGIVMTDWWAMINEEGMPPERTNLAAMARAQNDLYMVCPEADKNVTGDNLLSSLAAGTLTLGELQRNAMNICGFLLKTHAYKRMTGASPKVDVIGGAQEAAEEEKEVIYYRFGERDEMAISLEEENTQMGSSVVFALDLEKTGGYRVQISAESRLGELAQLPVTLICGSVPKAVFTFNGTEGKRKVIEKKIVFKSKYEVLRLYFGQNGLDAKEVRLIFDKPLLALTDEEAYLRS